MSGFKIPFFNNIYPNQTSEPLQPNWTKTECDQLQDSIHKLLVMQAICKVDNIKGQFISPVFLVPKSDGTRRFILNLKKLNEHVDSPHFKMEDHRTVCKVLRQGDFLAKIDFKDAYYCVPIHTDYRKYLRFRFMDQLYEYNCLPFGLSCAPRLFTKLIRPVISHLRNQSNRSVVFLDDFLLLGDTKQTCKKNILETIKLVTNLGLMINYEKSVLQPQNKIEFLGFEFDSNSMKISLPIRKRSNIMSLIANIETKSNLKIIDLAQLIGSLIAASPAIPYSMLHTRYLENVKQIGLLSNCNDFNGNVQLNKIVINELQWWKEKLPNGANKIRNDTYDYEFDSDSSLSGWGCVYNNTTTRGFWSAEEQGLHINTLELKAVLNGLKSLFKTVHDSQILVRCDSTTAICYINKQGGCRSETNHQIAVHIWDWCEERDNFIFATYINTKDNFIADSLSRSLIDENDFMLDNDTYEKITRAFGLPVIDLFATSLTAKCKRFISWFPDPKSEGVDAFTVRWADYFYAFPPFNLMSRVIQKIISNKAKGIVVAPYWHCQAWYPLFLSLCVSQPLIFKKKTFKIINPYSSSPHPLSHNLTLMAAVLSGQE